MEPVLLKDGETSIKTNETKLIIYFKNKKRTHWINAVIFLIVYSLIIYNYNIGVGELLVSGIFGGIVMLALYQVTELTFNKTSKQIVRQYSFFGKVLKTKKLLNNYDKVKYLIKLDTQSDGENSVTGYFFTATLRKKNIHLYVFKTLEDARYAVEILNKYLNLIENQIDLKN